VLGAALLLLTAGPVQAQSSTDAFLDRLGELAGQAGDLLSRAETINAAWEGGEVGFSDTADQLRELETDAALLLAAVQEITPPDDFASAMDQLSATAGDLSAAASAMVAGLRVADSGEARQAAQTQFRESVETFQNLAAGIRATGTTTTTTTTSPSTTTTVAEASTTTAPAPTTTIVIELGTPADTTVDDGGAPWVLVPIALMAGVGVGLLAGMLLGAKTRRRLIDQLRAVRGNNGRV
jgi:hypothetical protein